MTFAESGLGSPKAQIDCNAIPKVCQSVFYFDPNILYDSAQCPFQPDASALAAASENWFVHQHGFTDSTHRVETHYSQTCNGAINTIPVWAFNNSVPAVAAWYSTYLQSNADAWDIYFMDDTDATIADQFYAAGQGMCGGLCSITQEFTTNSAISAEHTSFVGGLTHVNSQPMHILFNSLQFDGQQTANNINLLNSSSQFIGAVCENCAVANGLLTPAYYQRVLNSMNTVISYGGIMVLQSRGSNAAGSSAQINQRLVTTGLTWLGYSEGHIVVWPDLEDNTTNLAVWPEDLIYPASPLSSMVAGPGDLQVAPGVWRREFATCYQLGAFFGHCAAIVNSTASTITVSSTWLSQTYGHIILLSGGDVLSGGSASLNTASFSPGVSTIPASGAILLAN